MQTSQLSPFHRETQIFGPFSRSHGHALSSQGHTPDLKNSQGFRL